VPPPLSSVGGGVRERERERESEQQQQNMAASLGDTSVTVASGWASLIKTTVLVAKT
jgi:hypothetical protein